MKLYGWLWLAGLTAYAAIFPVLYLAFGVPISDNVASISGAIGVLLGFATGQMMSFARLDYRGRTPPADTYTYRSVTQGYIVTWTRGDDGIWNADDGRDGIATDEDIRLARTGGA